MFVYSAGLDSVGTWAWRTFLDRLEEYWPLRFLATFAQCS